MKSPALVLILAFGTCIAGPITHARPIPVRLYDIPASRFVVDDLGQRWVQRGTLSSLGQFQIRTVSGVLPTVTIPDEALNQTVIPLDAWFAYANLNDHAVANFEIDEVRGRFSIGLRDYYFLDVAEDPKLDMGTLVNISTRGRVATDQNSMIGGFVVEGEYRWVLIRGIGPGLIPFGVGDAVADPHIAIYKAGSKIGLYFNDDWGQRYDADAIEQVSEQLGAFPLARGSKDAAYLVELAPGAYTVHLATNGTPGTGLLEIYVVP